MQSYPMDKDLIVGLAKLAKIERVSMASIVRRALRHELEDAGVVKGLGKVFGPTSRDSFRMQFPTSAAAEASRRPGDDVRGRVIHRKLPPRRRSRS